MKYPITLALLFIGIYLLSGQNVGIGTSDPKAKLDVGGDMILKSIDLNIPDGTIYQLNVNTNKFNHYKLVGPASNFQIAGITAAEHDRIVSLYNRTGVSLEVYNDDINTLPDDRILTGTGGTFAVYPGGNVVLKYDTLITKWEIISSHYNSLDYFGSAAGVWAPNANDIYNTNSGNVGIGTITPTAKFTVNGNLALQSDTIHVSCAFLPPTPMIIDNVAKNRSVLHIVADGCVGFYYTPVIAGLTGGADGKIVTLVSHVNNLPIEHLRGAPGIPSPADSLNMIELYEPNGNGPINQPASYILNKGGSVTLVYDNTRNRWKVLAVFGEVKTETFGWFKGPDPNDIYNPNSGNVGIGTGIPGEKLDVNGNALVRDTLKVDDKIGIGNVVSNASLAVYRGTGSEGTAKFFGTSFPSAFNTSTAEHTYIRGGKVDSKVMINDQGGQVGIGAFPLINSQLQLESSRTGVGATALDIYQNTPNSGHDSYGLLSYTSGGSNSNFGLFSSVGGAGNNNYAGFFVAEGFSNGFLNCAIYAVASGALTERAGLFDGTVQITGDLSKSSGSFLIDHPQDPANKYLYHSFVESPDMMNIYNGNIVTNNAGEASVQLPEYFFILNKDFRYQLTVMGQFAQAIILEKIDSTNQFKIKTDKPGVEVSWQVTGIRQDAWANAHRIVPEVEKEERNKGKYLNPEVFGQPEEKGIHHVKRPAENRQVSGY